MAKRRNSGGANMVYHYYRCSTARYDKVYRRKCQQHASFPADPIDADLWKWVKTLISEPRRMRMAFQEYRSFLHSDENPVRGKLAKKRKLISSTERELSQLARHTKDADALLQELEQSTKLEEHMQTIGKYVATATSALKAADKDEGAKRKFLQRLGVGVVMGVDGNSKYVDWVICTPNNFHETLRNQNHRWHLHGVQVGGPIAGSVNGNASALLTEAT